MFYHFFDRGYWRIDPPQRDRDIYVGRIDAQFGKPAACCFLRISRRRDRAGFRVFHHGAGSGRSSCGPGDYCNDLSQYKFDRYKCTEQTEMVSF